MPWHRPRSGARLGYEPGSERSCFLGKTGMVKLFPWKTMNPIGHFSTTFEGMRLAGVVIGKSHL